MLRQVVGRSSTGLLAGSQCVLGQCSRWVTARCSASAPRGRLRATPIQATTAPTALLYNANVTTQCLPSSNNLKKSKRNQSSRARLFQLILMRMLRISRFVVVSSADAVVMQWNDFLNSSVVYLYAIPLRYFMTSTEWLNNVTNSSVTMSCQVLHLVLWFK